MAADRDRATFTVAEVAAAVGLPVSTLRSWIQSGFIRLDKCHDVLAAPGGTRLLSLRRADQIGIAAALVSMGEAPKRAAKLALGFSDVGDGPTPDTDMLPREPDCLFEEAYTFLVAHPELDLPRIVRVTETTLALQISIARPCILLPLNPVVERIRAALVES